MPKENLISINIKGGILSPRQLRDITTAANQCGSDHIYFGERQNIYVNVNQFKLTYFLNRLTVNEYTFEVNEMNYPNISSSYPAIDLFAPNNWLDEGVMQDVLDSFDYQPKIKVNVVDINQGLVPAFTGHLNFIASTHINFWYLYIRHPSTRKLVCWPHLIYSTDLAVLAKELEKHILDIKNFEIEELGERIKLVHKYISMEMDEELKLPRYRFPYYEGLYKYGDKHWLGIYRRNNEFPSQFLENLAILCSETNIGKIYITPWKSIIIKEIKEEDRIKWEMLLGRFGINIRHTSFELNWKLADLDKRANRLKKYLVDRFDKIDIRTYGVTFGIKTRQGQTVPASIQIRENALFRAFGISFFPSYDILHTEDFNPNNPNLILYEKNRVKRDLVTSLNDLCKKYYSQLSNAFKSTVVEEKEINAEQKEVITTVHQCSKCFTIYDPEYGDMLNNIQPGVFFTNLDASYSCPTCGTGKNDFTEIKQTLVG